jgi:uncharacterized protein Yka (UPF0111/DUF47 family)
MKYSTDILRIVEAGLKGDVEQVRKHTKALADKMHHGDHMKRAILKRLEKKDEAQPALTVFPK